MADLPEIRLIPANAESPELAGTKLGGKPEWIQVEWQPACCDQPMTFLGQMDSLDIPQAGLPDSSMVYVFYCASCFAVSAQVQLANGV